MEKLIKLLTIAGAVLCVILCIALGIVLIQVGIVLWVSAVFLPSIILDCLGIGLIAIPIAGVIVVIKGGD